MLALLELGRKARHAVSARELGFMAVNDSHALAPYRQAALWLSGRGVYALSGVVQVEANVPYAQWLNRLCRHLADTGDAVQRVQADALPEALGAEWADWLPAHGLWVRFAAQAEAEGAAAGSQAAAGGVLFARDLPWTDPELALLGEWLDTWQHAWHAQQGGSRWAWLTRRRGRGQDAQVARPWWKRTGWRWTLAVAVLACIPVRLSVLVPGELVPAAPAVISAPLDGVIERFHVQPNARVAKDQALFDFDEVLIQARLTVLQQALSTAEAEYRQAAQQALNDPRSKAQLALLTGKIEERRAELAFAQSQLTRARVLAPRDGVALFDDPSEWIGRPVTVGERVMRIADPDDVEIEAWVPVADAIPLQPDARVSLFLKASPLSPVDGQLRYMGHAALQRPDGSYAYRLRAQLSAATEHRVGLKGTARLQGGWVPLGYWALRRPLASVRAFLGW